MQGPIRAIFALACAALAAGCDQQGRPIQEFGLDKLAKGVSTESDVRMVMGQPDTVRDEADGRRSLEYPKGPEGHRTWVFIIGNDGRLEAYSQVLTEQNFGNVKVGMSKDAVRRLLGRPRTTVQFRLKNEEVWDWRYRDPANIPRLFNVHFDIDSGNVVRTSASDDPQHAS